MQKMKRRLKVYKKTKIQYKRKAIGAVIENVTEFKEMPAILLSGDWLAECNFLIGDYIDVNISDGKIIISKQ